MSRPYYASRDQGSLKRLVPELIRARELLIGLVSKDIRAQYRFAVMGFMWAIVEPLMMTLVLTFVFVVMFQLELREGAGKTESAVLLLCAYLFWRFFADSLSAGSRSMVDNATLVKKVNFPREVIPLAVIGRCLVNLAIGLVIFLPLNLLLGGSVGAAYVWFVPIFGILLAMVAGLNLLFSTLHTTYRDVGYIVNVALVFGFYATPIFYSMDIVPEGMWWARFGLLMNPMTGVIGSFQRVLVENQPPDPVMLIWPTVFGIGCLVVGVVVFRKRSGTISDYL